MPEIWGKMPITEQSWLTVESVQRVQPYEQGVELDCGNARIIVSILAANLVRVRMAPKGEFLPRRSWAVAIADEQWERVPFELEETAETLELKTEQIHVRIGRNPIQISCFDPSGRAFAQDAPGGGLGWRQGAIANWKKIETDEHFYGFGERTGLLDKLSDRLTNWTTDALDYTSLTDEMYQAIPFFMALRPELGYGIFFNTTFWSQFDIGAEQAGIWKMQSQDKNLDYYIIYGPEPAQILQTYTQLTGRMPMPPRWALGYHQCRWSYDSEEEVRQLAQEFRQRQIPCDVIHLDIDYMCGFRVFTWSPKRFPDPKTMVKDLSQNGFKFVTIIDPGVKEETEADYLPFDEGLEHDYFVRTAEGKVFHGYVWPGRAVFPDFLREEVREWWGNQHQDLVDAGIAGIWNDMNEPAMNDRPFGDPGKKIWFPLNAPQGPVDEQTTHAEAHNLYGQMMARACAEGLERLRPNARSFVLTRSGYAGVQRWSAVWTGDNQSLWEYLEMSLPALCNLGLSGVAFVGEDIGGFAGNATAELFARWMQVGMLYPMMRAHSIIASALHEPWVFGDRVEKICQEYIQLRYRLLPYLYTLFWEAATTGAPILRPLLYHFPNDPKTYNLYDQVLLGPSLMAAPVYRPGVEERLVYLPEGVWYDWWSGEMHQGASHIVTHAPLEKMPLFVRAGAIIPLAPLMQYTDERPMDELRLRVYPGEGEWTLYEDDGRSFEYRTGAWATTTYRVHSGDPQTDSSQTIVEIATRQGEWQPQPRQVTVEVIGKGEQQFEDDGSDRRLTF